MGRCTMAWRLGEERRLLPALRQRLPSPSAPPPRRRRPQEARNTGCRTRAQARCATHKKKGKSGASSFRDVWEMRLIAFLIKNCFGRSVQLFLRDAHTLTEWARARRLPQLPQTTPHSTISTLALSDHRPWSKAQNSNLPPPKCFSNATTTASSPGRAPSSSNSPPPPRCPKLSRAAAAASSPSATTKGGAVAGQ